MNKFEYKNLTPFKWFVLENFPFIDADFDALTEWQLFCKLGKEINKIIVSENTLGTQMENVTNAFIELQNYVNNYFANLDVQEEINNKLNEMAESGQLTDIIAQYLNLAGVLAFNTVDELSKSENLVDGSIAKTLGTNSYNDGYGNYYKIRNISNTDVVDNDNIIRLINSTTLVAEKIKNNYIDEKVSKNKLGFAEDNSYYVPLGTPLYVDKVNGNDNNDGLTTNTAFKTIKGLFDKYVKDGNINPNIYLKCDQIHDFPFFNIISMVIHFSTYGEQGKSATLNMSNTYHAFYNSHIRFNGTENHPLVITGTNFYFDGGNIGVSYTTINQRITLNSCHSNFISSNIKDYKLNYSNCNFYKCTVGITQSWSCNITYRECYFNNEKEITTGAIQDLINVNLLIMGVSKLDMANANANVNYFQMTGGSISITSMLTVQNKNTKLFAKAVDLSGSILIITQDRYNYLSNIATKKVDIRNGSITSTLNL